MTLTRREFLSRTPAVGVVGLLLHHRSWHVRPKDEPSPSPSPEPSPEPTPEPTPSAGVFQVGVFQAGVFQGVLI